MKNLNLLLLTMLIAVIGKAQIKIWPGGNVSYGTTTYAPYGDARHFFWGGINIRQSDASQNLLQLDAFNNIDYSYSMSTTVHNPLVKNYSIIYNSPTETREDFFVYGNGDVWHRNAFLWSDSTLKTQIEDIDSALIKIGQLHGVSYKYKMDIADTSIYGGANAKSRLGLLAQEVQLVIPEAVDTTDEGIYGINYPSLTGLLIEGIKDLDSKVTRMEYWQKDTATGSISYKDGSVGIGTDSPSEGLDVQSTFYNQYAYDSVRNVIANTGGFFPGPIIYSRDIAAGKYTYITFTPDNAWIQAGDSISENSTTTYFTSTGVGIGTNSPEATLDVVGGAYIHTPDSLRGILLEWGDKYDTLTAWNIVNVQHDEVSLYAEDNITSIGSSIRVATDGNIYLSPHSPGGVGIGITPTAKLHVYANDGSVATTKAGYFYATGATSNYGIHAYASISTGNNYAAYLQGDVMTTGTNYTPSDEKLKTNIRPVGDNTLGKIKTLNVGTYEFNADMGAKHNFPKGQQIGIMAQDIEKQWPMLVNTGKHPQLTDPKDSTAVPAFDEFKVVNYTGLIPVLVKGIQELDDKVNTLQPTNNDSIIKALVAQNAVLKAENEDLKKDVASIKDMLTQFGDDLQYCCFNQNNNQRPTEDGSKLEQNNPNPFSENTVIHYYIAQHATNASIRISNLSGTLLNAFKIDSKGAGQILISGNSLTAGAYIYELIVDGKQVDSKKMILTY